jgi:phosphoribosylamine--glycine ligase
MGTTLFWTTRQSKLYRETIQKMEERLRGYVGYFDINCICDRETIYPLEATCRFGYPTIFVNMEGLAGPLAETMYKVARGEQASFEIAGPIAVCVVVASPPWPYPSKEVFRQYGENSLVIVHCAEGARLPSGIYPAEMRYADGDFYTAGYTGFTAIAAASASTIEEARGEAYNRVGLVNISNMMFRTDIGATWHSDMASLREWGWLNES